MFLGGNQSMSLSSHDFSECISNSIYFLDDRWFEMDVDYLYGGHDFGFFNLDDEEIRQFYHYDLEKFDPPPFWITPIFLFHGDRMSYMVVYFFFLDLCGCIPFLFPLNKLTLWLYFYVFFIIILPQIILQYCACVFFFLKK